MLLATHNAIQHATYKPTMMCVPAGPLSWLDMSTASAQPFATTAAHLA